LVRNYAKRPRSIDRSSEPIGKGGEMLDCERQSAAARAQGPVAVAPPCADVDRLVAVVPIERDAHDLAIVPLPFGYDDRVDRRRWRTLREQITRTFRGRSGRRAGYVVV
jgi:hypothetical protein